MGYRHFPFMRVWVIDTPESEENTDEHTEESAEARDDGLESSVAVDNADGKDEHTTTDVRPASQESGEERNDDFFPFMRVWVIDTPESQKNDEAFAQLQNMPIQPFMRPPTHTQDNTDRNGNDEHTTSDVRPARAESGETRDDDLIVDMGSDGSSEDSSVPSSVLIVETCDQSLASDSEGGASLDEDRDPSSDDRVQSSSEPEQRDAAPSEDSRDPLSVYRNAPLEAARRLSLSENGSPIQVSEPVAPAPCLIQIDWSDDDDDCVSRLTLAEDWDFDFTFFE